MAYFTPSHGFRHDYVSKTGVLLINLGTPKAPTSKALRPYLKEFLSDRRVIEIPRALWWFILNGLILNTRPVQSAKKYASIWEQSGSPLYTHTQQQTALIKTHLSEMGLRNLLVDFAMRYGSPSVDDVISRMSEQGVERLLVIPLYPQYAGSSSASAMDQVFRVLMKLRNMPEIRTVRHFHDDVGYIRALADKVRAHWRKYGNGDKLIMSFHGVPRFTRDKGDPYHCECHKTARLLSEELGLSKQQYQVCFQSRFGRTEWLQPYTSEVLSQLGRDRTAKLDIICPGFIVDCLETLEEIAIEGKETFLSQGGGEYRYISCLNEDPKWILAISAIIQKNLTGWSGATTESATLRQQRAEALGAEA